MQFGEFKSAKRDLSMNQALENKRYKKYLEEEEQKLTKKLDELSKEAAMLKIVLYIIVAFIEGIEWLL